MTMLRQYSTPILLSAVVILSLTFYNHAQNSRTIIQDKDDNIEVLRTSVTEIEGEFNDALNHNTVLTNENTSLKERIAILKKQVANLRWKVKVQDKNIASYKTTLTSLQNELREKEQLLAKMNASALTKDQAITELSSEKEILKKSINDLSTLLDEEIENQKTSKLELIASKLREEKIEALKEILFNTQVNFISISPSKKELGRKLNKIRRSGAKWKYTNVSFDLNHPNTDAIIGKTFEMRIVNITTGEPVPYIESNPLYPDSEFNTTGIKFEYDGSPVTLVHTNNELKSGENYRVEIKLMDGEHSYPLLHGTQAFVINKKALK